MEEGVGSEEEVDVTDQRGFWEWNKFSFRYHDATNRKKERGRKKDKQKSTNTINISKYKKLKVRMHENA